MVWYIPPLSPIKRQVESSQEQDFIDNLRIPITYLANMLTAGDQAPVRQALKRLAAVRQFMRSKRVENRIDEGVLDSVGLPKEAIEEMYRLLALAQLEGRFVLPTTAPRDDDIFIRQGCCGYGDNV